MANIKETLEQSLDGLLNEEALNEIENAFNAAVEERSQLTVEAALTKQDEEHAEKVGALLEAIDDDHTAKLNRIVEALTENHTTKLKQVISKFQGTLNEEAGDFKSTVVGSVSNYLDLYLDKTFPQDMLEEAVTNKRAKTMLEEVRSMLSVDMALATESIRDAVVDGKQRIDEASQKLDQVVTENSELKGELESLKADRVLEELSANLPDYKKKYVKKVLEGKNAQFITENFDYTLDLFDKETQKQETALKEEAQQEVKGALVDPVVEEEPQQVVEENVEVDNDPAFNSYMNELGKY